MTLSSIQIGGTDFAQTNTCGPSLSPGGSCMVTVTFTPTAAGLRTGLVVIRDSAFGGDSGHKVKLSGNGT